MFSHPKIDFPQLKLNVRIESQVLMKGSISSFDERIPQFRFWAAACFCDTRQHHAMHWNISPPPDTMHSKTNPNMVWDLDNFWLKPFLKNQLTSSLEHSEWIGCRCTIINPTALAAAAKTRGWLARTLLSRSDPHMPYILARECPARGFDTYAEPRHVGRLDRDGV